MDFPENIFTHGSDNINEVCKHILAAQLKCIELHHWGTHAVLHDFAMFYMQAVRQMVDPMFEDKERPVDFIVVGPFEEDTKRVTGESKIYPFDPRPFLLVFLSYRL